MRIGAFNSWAQTTGHAIAAPPQRPRNSRCRISALSGELLGNLAVLPEIAKLQSLLGTAALGEDKEKRPARASRFRLALKPYFGRAAWRRSIVRPRRRLLSTFEIAV